VRISGTKGEAITTLDDVSAAELTGKADLSARSLAFASLPVPGAAQTLTATIDNLSQAAVGKFRVALYQGDPMYPQTKPTLVQGPRELPGLAAGESQTVTFPDVTMPDTGGRFVYTVVVDTDDTIDEVTNSNNEATAEGTFRVDPAIAFDAAGQAMIKATLLNATGTNNVAVDATLTNLGDVPVTDLTLNLFAGRNGAAPVLAGTKIVPIVQPGQSLPVRFLTTGLDGDMLYRVSIDAPSLVGDVNLSNDTGTTMLPVHGMADLRVGGISLDSVPLQQGKPVTLTTTISNTGIADARGVLVEVFAVGAPQSNQAGPARRYRIAATHVDVAAVGSQTVSLPLDTSRLAGRYTLEVRVNRFHSVLESDETNDTASLANQDFAAKTVSS